MADAPTLFFDLGGVLLTNGWDTGARRRAAETFGLDFPEFQTRHEMLKTAFETGRLSIDHYVNRSVFHRPRTFTAQEFKTFQFLVQNADRVISRDELLNEVWGYQNYPSTRTVDNHILKLRQKLEKDPSSPVHCFS